jgi:hypothetical protein
MGLMKLAALPRSMLLALGSIALAVTLACDREPRGGPDAAGAPVERKPFTAERPFRFPAAERLVAIGDLHGDLAATRAALRLARAIDSADRWIGGKTVVVQTGDVLDRGDDELLIWELLGRLRDEAKNAGGALHTLNGNHELMNVAGDFRYVTPSGFLDFERVAAEGAKAMHVERFIERARPRARAFLPGASYARRLADQNSVIVVGDTVFAHGGVTLEHVDYDIGRVNSEVSRWMRGELASLSPIVEGPRSVFWIRDYGEPEPQPTQCQILAHALERLAARRLVVGHTVQKRGISAGCEGRVWRIDVGLSAFYGQDSIEVLEIRGGVVRVLSAERYAKPALEPAIAPGP